MPGLQIERLPELHDPVAVVAFSGWNDAASAATDAARYVVRRMGARRFATIDPEPFYDFSDNRPQATVTPSGRVITWPTNEFFYARNPTGAHDIIIGVGAEPDLQWRTFAGHYLEMFARLQASLVVSLGALLADVPHTRPARVTGTAADPAVAARLDLTTSRYEGPTGIVGVLHDTLRRQSIQAASLWANVPHYITTAQNPPATAALLRRLQDLLGISFDLRELDESTDRFVNEVNTALAANPDVSDYVRRLEAAADAQPSLADALPEGGDIVLDVEEFLRRQRDA